MSKVEPYSSKTTQPMLGSIPTYDNEWSSGLCDLCSDFGETLFAYMCFAWFE